MDLLTKIADALPDKYDLGSPLGKGGQGAVFDGKVDEQRSAIKLFFPGDDPRRLGREIATLGSLQCPNLVHVVDQCTITLDGMAVPVVAYEFVDGPNLRLSATPNMGTAFTEAELLQLGEEVGRAIEALWTKRIVHRDVKPENIVRDRQGKYVLVDLGLAQHLDLRTITPMHAAPGTRGYRCPEQLNGRRKLTLKADVFALGVTMFELATQQHPWNRDETAMMQKPTSLPQLAALRPDLTSRACALIHRMLAAVPARRPGALASAFAALRGGA